MPLARRGSRALRILLRQAVLALLLFGWACFGMLGGPRHRSLVEPLIIYASRTHHAYQEVAVWMAQVREEGLAGAWPRAQEVWRRVWQRQAPADQASWALVRPAAGPITLGFGWRTHPVHQDLRYHTGVDIGAELGAPVVAVRAGRVVETGNHPVWGRFVLVEHHPDQASFYAHLDTVAVRPDDRVERGGSLGTVGQTGSATAPHLHFEWREKGEPVDPEPLLRAAATGP